MQIKNIVSLYFGIIIGPILWKQSSFPTILNQVRTPVSSQRPSTPVKNIPCAESELRYLKSQHIHCVEAKLWNFKSQNILCAKVELQVTEYSACGIFLVPSAMARMTRVRRATGPWVKAILKVQLFTVPSWRWPILGFLCVFSDIIKQ